MLDNLSPAQELFMACPFLDPNFQSQEADSDALSKEIIHKQESLVNVQRLLILFSITNSGLPMKHFDHLRQGQNALSSF